MFKFCKTRNVKSPVRAHPEDAGFDFFVPEDLTIAEMKDKDSTTGSSPEYDVGENGFISSIMLRPGESVLIPSGIKVKVPTGHAMIFFNKSGIASKRSLDVGANVVDVGYEGICHINLHNVSNKSQTINAGDKIVQGILFKLSFDTPEEVENETALYGDIKSARGEGGFGSSGTK